MFTSVNAVHYQYHKILHQFIDLMRRNSLLSMQDRDAGFKLEKTVVKITASKR